MELEISIENSDTGEVGVERMPIEGRVVLGRGPESPVALDGPLISREHIVFELVDGRLCVADLSANGSWLNDVQLQAGRRYPVTEADRVKVPGYELRCVLTGGVPERAAAAVEAPPQTVKSFLASITATETTVLLVFGAAVAVTVVFLQL
jgi:predicted component of type VI protein secretion system